MTYTKVVPTQLMLKFKIKKDISQFTLAFIHKKLIISIADSQFPVTKKAYFESKI